MLFRRAVTAAGLAVALVGAGAGTALADGDGVLGGLTDTVEETTDGARIPAQQDVGNVTDTVGEATGGSGGTGGSAMETIDEATGGTAEDIQNTVEGAASNITGNARVPAQNGGLAGDDPAVELGGACADVASEGQPPCESDTFGSEALNACVEDNGGVVSEVAGGEDGLAEATGTRCTQTGGGPMPAPGGPGGNGGGGGPGGGGGFMPAPEDITRAAPARSVAEQPTFVG